MGPGLHEFNLASHLVWVVGGIAMAVLAVVALLELADGIRAWLSRRRSPRQPTGDGFRVTEDGRLRKEHLRRAEPGFHSLRSRGLGEPPLRTVGEWSPTGGRHPLEPDDQRRRFASVLEEHLSRLLHARGASEQEIEEDFRAHRRRHR